MESSGAILSSALSLTVTCTRCDQCHWLSLWDPFCPPSPPPHIHGYILVQAIVFSLLDQSYSLLVTVPTTVLHLAFLLYSTASLELLQKHLTHAG